MLVWTLILTVVGYNGETSHISARYATMTQCYAAGDRISLSLADNVESTSFSCIKERAK